MNCYDAMNNHLDKYFNSEEIFVFDEKYSPDFHLDVYAVLPGEGRNFFTLVTSGISSTAMNVPDPSLNPFIELFTILPAHWPINDDKLGDFEYYWPIKLIKDLGRYPHTNKTWLGFGHTVAEPKDSYLFQNGFAATILINSKMISKEFQSLEFENGSIDLLMPLPITEKELRYKKENGIEAFYLRYLEYDEDDVIGKERMSFV